MSAKKTKKQLRKEATLRANRIRKNLIAANEATPTIDPNLTTPKLKLYSPLEHSSSDVPAVEVNTTIAFQSSIKDDDTTLDACLDLFENNMGEMYKKSSWGLNMKEKKEELIHEKARYLIVSSQEESVKKLLAFAHFRFEEDDDDKPTAEVLYLYEIQINALVQRNGLGKRMMDILEMIAMEYGMRKVMLTVFKTNKEAMAFYKKLNYVIDESSPSEFGEEADYEILSKIIHRD